MMRFPSKSDQPGYIYGFREKTGYNSEDQAYQIKIGRTKNDAPQTRICQWEIDDGQLYLEIFTERSEYNKKLESLIHLIFDYARKKRIINGLNRIEWF
jgi:hypothetical protein